MYPRFPPEPNGYLHTGHSKVIFTNFGYAAHHGEKRCLRYENMKLGKYRLGEAALRTKQDLDDKRKTYPTYDFTHCLVDRLIALRTSRT